MKAMKLAGLQPEPVFAYFEKLCSIPHGSRNTKQISDYFVSFAREHGLRCIQDAANNVIIFKSATPGYEDHEPVILQGHMDMVCQKDEDCILDMEKDPVDVTHDGTYIFARGTSLGGDNGSAVALCLALLADETVEHPPLEVIFTADEEIGLVGANALDLSMLKGRRMINLDSCHEGKFTAGCAGGARITLESTLEKDTCTDPVLQINVEGLRGGHSGGMIRFKHANANKAMGNLLQKISNTTDMRLVSFAGGTAGNAIPQNCCAEIALPQQDIPAVQALCAAFQEELRTEHNESTAIITTGQVKLCAETACTESCTARVLKLLEELPHGVQAWNQDFADLPLTSLNMGIAKIDERLYLHFAVRSNVNQNRSELQEKLKGIAEANGCSYSESGVYSAWEYRKDSPLRETMARVYEQMTGKAHCIQVTHAGLECGVIAEKLPGLDCVSGGPNGLYLHTSNEKLEIGSMARFWDYLLALLKEL